MYYLQSRYYNAEWGRFINADGIVGQTGELLSHNMFAYCKNNPVTLKDENGFRPEYAANPGHETSEERADSFMTMNKTVKRSSSHKSVAQQGMEQAFSMAVNSGSISKEVSKDERIQGAVSATNSVIEAGMGGVGVAISIIHPLADGELAHLGKPTIPAETQALAQAAICQQSEVEAKYFGLMNMYDDVGNWISNQWDYIFRDKGVHEVKIIIRR